MTDLKTNYVDDVLDTSVNVKRKYRMIQNADGTVSFDDVTTYTQNGDSFGAKDINDTNAAVNELNSNLSNKQPIGNYALFEPNSTDTANIGIDLAADNIYINGVRKDNKNIIGLNIFPDRITSPCYDAATQSWHDRFVIRQPMIYYTGVSMLTSENYSIQYTNSVEIPPGYYIIQVFIQILDTINTEDHGAIWVDGLPSRFEDTKTWFTGRFYNAGNYRNNYTTFMDLLNGATLRGVFTSFNNKKANVELMAMRVG